MDNQIVNHISIFLHTLRHINVNKMTPPSAFCNLGHVQILEKIDSFLKNVLAVLDNKRDRLRNQFSHFLFHKTLQELI